MGEFSNEVIEATTYAVGCSKEQAIIILKETERQKLLITNGFINNLNTLQELCFTREAQLSEKIKGHDFNNGYSCALHDIRGELEKIKEKVNTTSEVQKR